MMTQCPECNATVSDKSEACPQCGYRMALPSFYVNSSSMGLDVTWLLMDYVEEVGAGDSCFSGGGASDVQILLNNYDDSTREATRIQGGKIMQLADRRMTQLSENSLESKQLLLLKCYVQAIRDLQVERTPENLRAIAKKIRERFLPLCTRSDDQSLFQSASDEMEKEADRLERESAAPSTEGTGNSAKRSSGGCVLSLVAAIVGLLCVGWLPSLVTSALAVLHR